MTEKTKKTIEWDEIFTDCQKLAQLVMESGGFPNKILCVTRGGLFPAALLARHLNIDNIETIGLQSYDPDMQQSQISMIKKPDPQYFSGALIVDDLVDTGQTFQYLRQKTSNCVFACLYAKPAGEAMTDFYVRSFPQDEWIDFPWEI